MSTPTTPTPKTDSFREQFKHCGSFTEYRREAERVCGELEISRDQWKAVAERLAEAVTNRRIRCQAITEFNQLKESK